MVNFHYIDEKKNFLLEEFACIQQAFHWILNIFNFLGMQFFKIGPTDVNWSEKFCVSRIFLSFTHLHLYAYRFSSIQTSNQGYSLKI